MAFLEVLLVIMGVLLVVCICAILVLVYLVRHLKQQLQEKDSSGVRLPSKISPAPQAEPVQDQTPLLKSLGPSAGGVRRRLGLAPVPETDAVNVVEEPEEEESATRTTLAQAGRTRSKTLSELGKERMQSSSIVQRGSIVNQSQGLYRVDKSMPVAAAESLLAEKRTSWAINPEEIEIAKRPDGTDWILGQGGFGKVYKAMRDGVHPVAVKVLVTDGHLSDAEKESFMKEMAILKYCRDGNIVQFIGSCIQGDKIMLITEFMPGGDLFHALTRPATRTALRWKSKGQHVALDVARGLHFLHSHNIVHCDIKSCNILLDKSGAAKISDVGLAKVKQGDQLSTMKNMTTWSWAAPEVLQVNSKLTEKVDIYSYGVVLWELITHDHPTPDRRLRPVRVPEECDEVTHKLLLDCLMSNPDERPRAKDIVLRLAKVVTANLQLRQSSKSLAGGEDSL